MRRFIISLFVCLSTLCAFAASGTAYVVEASSLNVRQKPSTDAAVLGKVTQGQVVMVLSIQNGWAQISFQKGTGYVSTKYIRKKSTSTSTSTSTQKSTASAAKSSSTQKSTASSGGFPYRDGLGARYGGWTEAGVSFAYLTGGFTLDMVHGCYIRDYIFVGAGAGFHGAFAPEGALLTVPIYAQTRGLLRLNSKVAPFVDLALGGYMGWLTDWENSFTGGGFYVRVAPGIRLGKHFHMSLGYERCGINTGVFAIGADW